MKHDKRQGKKRLSRGMRKYLRLQKAQIRRASRDPQEAEIAIQALREQF